VASEENLSTFNQLTELDNNFDVVEYHNGTCPAIYFGPVSVKWMKELTKITEGYPTFYKGYNSGSTQTEEQKWYNYNVNAGKLY